MDGYYPCMASRSSSKVERRLTAAQRVRAKRAEEERILAAGVEAVEAAHQARQEALAAADAADDKFREAVAALVGLKQPLEDIAELAEVPLSDVRAARRAKQSASDDDAEESVSAGGRSRRQLAVDPPAGGTTVPAFLGDQDGASEGEQGAADELTALTEEMGLYGESAPEPVGADA